MKVYIVPNDSSKQHCFVKTPGVLSRVIGLYSLVVFTPPPFFARNHFLILSLALAIAH